MDVLVVIEWLCVASAEYEVDFNMHLRTFMKEKKRLFDKEYRPVYHVSAPVGWLNEPAALIYYKRRYHLYQYHPYDGAWGQMQWGHAASTNLVYWIHYPPALIPKEHYGKHGCLAGSAVIYNDYLIIFYTGTVLSGNQASQTQNVAISSDGILFQKYLYNPVLLKSPSSYFRNSKVWRYNMWYMLVGSTKGRQAELLLYSSNDLFNWHFNGTVAESYGDMGHVWEDPDLFEIDGQHVLILSVQEMQPDSNRFKNLYQTGYVLGNFNYLNSKFEDLEVSTATFKELDRGHDFYGAKTVQVLDGRRILIGWLGMWESEFKEAEDGWASMLTLARELKLTPQGCILMTPVREAVDLRLEVTENAWYNPGEVFYAGSKSFELLVNSTSVLFDVYLMLEWSGRSQYRIGYSVERGRVSVDRGGYDGIRQADWLPVGQLFFRIFVDHSLIEVFCGNGEVVFSSRIYPKKSIRVRIGGDTRVHVTQYKLRKSVGYNKHLSTYIKNHVMNNKF